MLSYRRLSNFDYFSFSFLVFKECFLSLSLSRHLIFSSVNLIIFCASVSIFHYSLLLISFHFPIFSLTFNLFFHIPLYCSFLSIFYFLPNFHHTVSLFSFSLSFTLTFHFLCSILYNYVYSLIYRWTDDSQVYINHLLNPSSVFISYSIFIFVPFFTKLKLLFLFFFSLTHLD